MISPKKIHYWIIKALEEPFLRAELRRVEMLLPERREPELQLIRGGRKKRPVSGTVCVKKMGKIMVRT